eukprot:7004066-Pyramimonas_sp.AAC.1
MRVCPLPDAGRGAPRGPSGARARHRGSAERQRAAAHGCEHCPPAMRSSRQAAGSRQQRAR